MGTRHEKKNGYSKSKDSFRQEYQLSGCTSATDALSTLLSGLSTTIGGMVRDDYGFEEQAVDSSGAGEYTGYVEWRTPSGGSKTELEAGGSDTEFELDTGGGSVHITQSLQTVNSYGTENWTGAAPDYKGAIGFDGEEVAGVDIEDGAFEFTIKRRYLASVIDAAYLNTLYQLSSPNHVNNDTFTITITHPFSLTLEFAAGECRFRGANVSAGTVTDDGNPTVNIIYRFSARPNETNITVGTMTVAAKAGWDYMWTLYGRDATATEGAVRQPKAVYVEKVYPSGDLSTLEP